MAGHFQIYKNLNSDILKDLIDTRYMPSVLGFFAALNILLFVDKVKDSIAEWLLPALIVYSLGAGILSYVQVLCGIRTKMKNIESTGDGGKGLISTCLFCTFMGFHIVWFCAFVIYLTCRCVL